MIKLGFCIQDFGPSQLAHTFLKNANNLLYGRSDISIYGFFETLSRPLIGPAFGIFNMTEVFGFDGILISTNAVSTHQFLKFPKPSKRIYYVNDLEWKNNPLGFEFYSSIMRSTEVWTRCEDYAELIKNNFGVPCKVNEDLNLEKFLD